jgi:hypothetical protein
MASRTRGGYYLLRQDHVKAADEFKALVRQYPADTAGHANLALDIKSGGDDPLAPDARRRLGAR